MQQMSPGILFARVNVEPGPAITEEGQDVSLASDKDKMCKIKIAEQKNFTNKSLKVGETMVSLEKKGKKRIKKHAS